METIICAVVTSVCTLVGVLIANSKHSAVLETKIDALTKQVEKHNSVIERTYDLETRVALLEARQVE